jgi:hypothetical protein
VVENGKFTTYVFTLDVLNMNEATQVGIKAEIGIAAVRNYKKAVMDDIPEKLYNKVNKETRSLTVTQDQVDYLNSKIEHDTTDTDDWL